MIDMFTTLLFLLAGTSIFGAGVYYFIKERKDKESRKIFSIISLVGLIVLIGTVTKLYI